MARLEINWQSKDTVAPQAAATGDASDAPGASTSMRAKRPMMVYVTSDEENDPVTRKLTGVVFPGEQLAIGAKFFDCYRVTAGNAMQDRILARAGRTAPRIVFLTRDYKVTSVLEKKQLSGGRIVRAMKKLARLEYKTSFDKMVKGYGKLLNELDRLEARKTQIADMRARLADRPNRAKQKKLERMVREYDADRAVWTKSEQELLDLKPKGRGKAAA